MESSLHRQLKEQLGAAVGGQTEAVVAGFRIDAIEPDGCLVEVQSGPLGPLRAKLSRLLPAHRVRVVKPLVNERRLVRRARLRGPDLAPRRSPKRGQAVDLFDDLVGLMPIYPHPNLTIELLSVAIDEIRVNRKRWPGYSVLDRRLREVGSSIFLKEAADLWTLLPGDLASPFTTLDLAHRLGRPLFFAQRVAYCLRLAGAAETVGKQGNRRVYIRRDPGHEASLFAARARRTTSDRDPWPSAP
jgi:hypothetical protein